MKWFIITSLSLLTTFSAGLCGDDRRRGLVYGGGIGMAPLSDFTVDNRKESDWGLGINGLIGFGWDERNLFVFEINDAYRHSDYYSEIGERTGFLWSGPGTHGAQNILVGYLGFAWYHYFGPVGKSAFTSIGVGWYALSPSSLGPNDLGSGYLIGGGYEFAPHLQVGGYYSFGHTRDSWITLDHQQITILVTYIRY